MSLFEKIKGGIFAMPWVINEVAALDRGNAKLREQLVAANMRISELEGITAFDSALQELDARGRIIDELRKQLEAAENSAGFSELAVNELKADIGSWKQRAEAAEAEIKAAREQEPKYYILHTPSGRWEPASRIQYLEKSPAYRMKLYSRSVPPADVQELNRECDDLARQLNESNERNGAHLLRIDELEHELSHYRQKSREENDK